MEKLNVLLVDDEYLVIDDLKTLIDWESHGFHICGSAANSAQALKLAVSFKPDIVFMDVSLPGTDGLLLSSKLKEFLPDLVIIILSGYMDFSYAQRAVELNALVYLVKHQVTPQRLLEVLESARQTLEKKRLSRQLERHFLLRNLLTDKRAGEPLQSSSLDNYRNPFLLALLSPILPFNQDMEAAVPRLSVHVSMIRSLSTKELDICDTLILENNILLFIQPISEFTAGHKYLSYLPGFIRSLLSSLEQNTGIPFAALWLGKESSLSSLQKDFTRLEKSCEIYRFYPDISFIQLPEFPETAPSVNDSFLTKDMFLHHHGKFLNELKESMRQIKESKNPKLLEMQIEKIVHLLNIIKEDLTLSPCVYIHEIEESLFSLCQDVYRLYQQQTNYSPSTLYTIDYIHKNYNKMISLTEIAFALNGNVMYLGQKFRKDTGKTFHEYLTDYRIEKACALLKTENLKVFEVAQAVGLSNSQYFSKIFRKATGLTPNEYRTRHYSPNDLS